MRDHWRADCHDVVEVANFTSVFELDQQKTKIRKKDRILNNDLKFLGLDKEGIRNMSEDNYNKFME